MNNERSFSIIDFGSSKIRLGIFDNYKENSKFFFEENFIFNFKDQIFENHPIEKILKKLILKSEKETNQHIKNINIMLDDPSCLTVDLSLKKKLETNINEINIKKFIQEAKILIENNYEKFKICHLIINEYVADGKVFNVMPKNIFINDLVIEIKFLLTSRKLINNLRNFFKSNHILVNNFYNSSYIKTLGYNSYFENYDIKFFLDIGYKKTSLTIYHGNKLKFVNYIPLGGAHITNDISNVLRVSLDDAEQIKKNINQTNIDLSNHHNDLLIKVIHARVEEIIDLCFKNIINLQKYKSLNSILTFSGEGSKLLSKNSISLKEEYNFFNEMNFFEESADTICNSAYNFYSSENVNEVTFTLKKQRKQGFFERVFYMFNL